MIKLEELKKGDKFTMSWHNYFGDSIVKVKVIENYPKDKRIFISVWSFPFRYKMFYNYDASNFLISEKV